MALIGYEAVANERLQTAVEETSYSAVVILTGFEGPEQDGLDNYYKVQAKVLDGIRGHITSKITFNMYTEVGDTPKIGIDPIFSLCVMMSKGTTGRERVLNSQLPKNKF
jgi:hypothetical protein